MSSYPREPPFEYAGGDQDDFEVLTVEMDDLRSSASDVVRRASDTLISALRSNGLAYLHFGGSMRDQYEKVIGTAFREARSFFSRLLDEKESAMPSNTIPVGVTRGYLPTTSEAGGATPELKEAFSWSCDKVQAKETHDNPFQYHNIWPSSNSEDMKQSFERLFDFFHDVMCALTEAIQPAFGSKERLVAHCVEGRSISLARSFHYLPSSSYSGNKLHGIRATGSAPHTDWGFATLVAQEVNSRALEVWYEKTKSWIPITGKKDTLILNGSDFLTLLSNGQFKSPKHRVILTPSERYSFVYFQYPGYHTPMPSLRHIDRETLSHISLLKDQRLSNKEKDGKDSLTTATGTVCFPVSNGIDTTFGAVMANKWADVARPVVDSSEQPER